MRAKWRLAFFVAVSVVPFIHGTARGIEPSNVLVLYNSAVSDSVDIKNHYLSVHPGVHALDIYHPDLPSGADVESITADQYLTLVRPYVLAGIQAIESTGGRVDVLTPTKGLPLRIEVTQSMPPSVFPNLPKYTDPQGVEHSILNWREYSSFESELAAIDRISIYEMMGDQSYTLFGHFTQNPYYQATAGFNHDQYGTRLAARLDGYTKEDVIAAIDRAQNAFVGPDGTSTGPVHFLVDNDLSQPYTWTMNKLVDEVLTPAGLPVSGNNDATFIGTAPGPVIGFDSHGVHQAATPDNYIEYMTTQLGTTLADGAVFTSLESFNAYSFIEGTAIPDPSQGQVGQWLKFGGTAGVGYVEEPTASWPNVSNENWLFGSLLDGKTFVEAAWSANRQISYVNTVIGDPLMVWRTLMLGDVNTDGVVDIADLAIMGGNWGDTVPAGGYGWTLGDMNSDGLVDIADLAMMSQTWGGASSWAQSLPLTMGLNRSQLAGALYGIVYQTPEPSSVALLAVGLGMLPVCRRLAGNRRSRRRSR